MRRAAFSSFFLLVCCASTPPEPPVAVTVASTASESAPPPAPPSPPPAPPPIVDPTMAVLASPPKPLNECVRDSDCVVSTFQGCCDRKEPFGAAKKDAARWSDECKRLGQCIDVEGLVFTVMAKEYVAKCVSTACVAVHRHNL